MINGLPLNFIMKDHFEKLFKVGTKEGKMIFQEEYPQFNGKKQNVKFKCPKCQREIFHDVPIPPDGEGDTEVIQCQCGGEYTASIFKNKGPGGYITIS